MTIEQIRKQIKKEYEEKLTHLTDENFVLRENLKKVLKENKEMESELDALRAKLTHYDNRINRLFDTLEVLK